MIRFERVPEPADFDKRARVPGTAWLSANPTKKRAQGFLDPLQGNAGRWLSDLCAYSAMHDAVGTVDHFVSVNEDRSKAYEWENYRYCAAWINSSKRNVPAGDLLDPHEIETDGSNFICRPCNCGFRTRFPTSFGIAPNTYWTGCTCVTTSGSCGNAESGTECTSAAS